MSTLEEAELLAKRFDYTACADHDAAWARFCKHAPRCDRVPMALVPWPKQADYRLELGVNRFRELSKRWHPDRFMSKFGDRLYNEERPFVLELVTKHMSQINQAWDRLKDAAAFREQHAQQMAAEQARATAAQAEERRRQAELIEAQRRVREAAERMAREQSDRERARRAETAERQQQERLAAERRRLELLAEKKRREEQEERERQERLRSQRAERKERAKQQQLEQQQERIQRQQAAAAELHQAALLAAHRIATEKVHKGTALGESGRVPALGVLSLAAVLRNFGGCAQRYAGQHSGLPQLTETGFERLLAQIGTTRFDEKSAARLLKPRELRLLASARQPDARQDGPSCRVTAGRLGYVHCEAVLSDKNLRQMQLAGVCWLSLRGTDLSGHRPMFCDLCTELPGLQALDLARTQIDNAPLAELSGISCCGQGSQARRGLGGKHPGCKGLRMLDVSANPRVKMVGMKDYLEKIPSLECIKIHGTSLSKQEISLLAEQLGMQLGGKVVAQLSLMQTRLAAQLGPGSVQPASPHWLGHVARALELPASARPTLRLQMPPANTPFDCLVRISGPPAPPESARPLAQLTASSARGGCSNVLFGMPVNRPAAAPSTPKVPLQQEPAAN